MSRETDQKIAEYFGLKSYWLRVNKAGTILCKPYAIAEEAAPSKHYTARFMCANYSTSDSDAVQLLPVLVEKGYTWRLQDAPTQGGYSFEIGYRGRFHERLVIGRGDTIAAAICSAIIQLIEKEGK